MSRHVIYENDRILLTEGEDVISGRFVMVFDHDLESETPDETGLVMDWSEVSGYKINYTGYPSTMTPKTIAHNYITDRAMFD